MTAPSSPPFRVSFTIERDDMVAYLRLVQRRLNLIGTLLGLATVAIGLFIGLFSNDLFTGAWAIVFGLVFFVLASTEYFDRWRVGRAARSILGTTATFTFDDDGVSSYSAGGAGRVPWSSVTEMIANERILVLRRDRLALAWIPTRAFASTDEREAVRAFIATHVGAPDGDIGEAHAPTSR